jgi:hypothetical protein
MIPKENESIRKYLLLYLPDPGGQFREQERYLKREDEREGESERERGRKWDRERLRVSEREWGRKWERE